MYKLLMSDLKFILIALPSHYEIPTKSRLFIKYDDLMHLVTPWSQPETVISYWEFTAQ